MPAKSGFAAMDPAALSAWIRKAERDMPAELFPRQRDIYRSFEARVLQECERRGRTPAEGRATFKPLYDECWAPFWPLYTEELHRLISGPLPVAIDKPIKFGPSEDLGLEPDDEEPTET